MKINEIKLLFTKPIFVSYVFGFFNLMLCSFLLVKGSNQEEREFEHNQMFFNHDIEDTEKSVDALKSEQQKFSLLMIRYVTDNEKWRVDVELLC